MAYRDLSPEQRLPPPVHGHLPNVFRAIDAKEVTVSQAASLSAGCSTLEIGLQDPSAQGYAGEPGNFMHRLQDRRASSVAVSVQSSPVAQHTEVTLTNLILGHTALLRVAALFLPDEDAAAAAAPAGGLEAGAPLPEEASLDSLPDGRPLGPGSEGASPPGAGAAGAAPDVAYTTAVDVRGCRAVWKYQAPPPGSRASLPAVHDFLSLFEDVLALDLPALSLRLPFAPGAPGSLVDASNASLLVAAAGCAGRSMLPLLTVPGLQLSCAPGAVGGAAGHRYSAELSGLELGAHPSHISMLSTAVQLYESEMQTLTRRPSAAGGLAGR